MTKINTFSGLEEEELAQIEQERIDRLDEELSRNRDFFKNKRGYSKALDILGLDPSKQKVMDMLGVDESVIEEAELENFERSELRIVR